MERDDNHRKRFRRVAGSLIDQTQTGHTVIIRGPGPSDVTREVIRRIESGDFRDLARLLSNADLKRVRPVLIAHAENASTLEPNLAQGLALLGGAAEVNVLRRHLRRAVKLKFGAISEGQQLEAIHSAHALLSVRSSVFAAKALVKAIRFGTRWTRQLAAGFVSEKIISGSSIRVERVLLGVLPKLLNSEDESFVGAFPALLQHHYVKACKRGVRLLHGPVASIRRRLITKLITMPYYGLDLLLEAYEHEPQVDLRLTIAAAVAPALSKVQMAKLVEKGLSDVSPAVRLRAAELLNRLGVRVARRLSARRDPDPTIDVALQPFRIVDPATRTPRAREQ